MRATYIYGAGDIRVINVPDPVIQQPTDATVRVVRACICGSDLHPYHNTPATAEGNSIGHECIGVVEETGAEVTSVSKGDLVIVPWASQLPASLGNSPSSDRSVPMSATPVADHS
jgi:threonine dehydrogenase-like Zn-dependent dehydrogenase